MLFFMLFFVEDRIFLNNALIPNYLPNFFLNAVAIMDVPAKVAVRYSHRIPNIPLDNNENLFVM
jgi:hypothetical protein